MKPGYVASFIAGGVLLTALIIATFWKSSPKTGLSDFTSDGCSLFPDRSLINSDDWCRCCFEHDIAYWRGGTEAERLAADEALRDCVLTSTGNAELAEAMFIGVRMGGSPYFQNWYRWGYGWHDGRGYQPLTEAEIEKAENKLADYFRSNPDPFCGRP